MTSSSTTNNRYSDSKRSMRTGSLDSLSTTSRYFLEAITSPHPPPHHHPPPHWLPPPHHSPTSPHSWVPCLSGYAVVTNLRWWSVLKVSQSSAHSPSCFSWCWRSWVFLARICPIWLLSLAWFGGHECFGLGGRNRWCLWGGGYPESALIHLHLSSTHTSCSGPQNSFVNWYP